MTKIRAAIAIGLNDSSNLSILTDRIESIFDAIGRNGIESQSSLFTTPAFPKGSGPDFVNAALIMNTELSPNELLARLHNIEAAFDRERPYRWAPRSCDLDLLFYDNLVLPNASKFEKYAAFSTEEAIANTPDELVLPHPRLHERAFVLGPLREIAPDFIHPVFNLTIEELWQKLPASDRAEIRKLD